MIDLSEMFSMLSLVDDVGLIVELQVKPTLVDEIKANQPLNITLLPRTKLVEEGKIEDFKFNNDGILCF